MGTQQVLLVTALNDSPVEADYGREPTITSVMYLPNTGERYASQCRVQQMRESQDQPSMPTRTTQTSSG